MTTHNSLGEENIVIEKMKYVITGLVFFLFMSWFLVLLINALEADAAMMKAQHCRETEETRNYYITQFIYGNKGQIIGSYPLLVEETKYACDDGARWR